MKLNPVLGRDAMMAVGDACAIAAHLNLGIYIRDYIGNPLKGEITMLKIKMEVVHNKEVLCTQPEHEVTFRPLGCGLQGTVVFRNVPRRAQEQFAVGSIATASIELPDHYPEDQPDALHEERTTYGVSMFSAIANDVECLRREAQRLAHVLTISHTITGGELQKILDGAKEATQQLKRIY
jgi:hypothetical protein